MATSKLQFSVHGALVNGDDPAKAAFDWTPVEATGEDLFLLITKDGRPFTSVFIGNHREGASWLKSSVYALDFDGTSDTQPLYKDIIEDEFIRTHALFAYPTPGMGIKPNERFRIVFAVEEPFIDAGEYRRFQECLSIRYPMVDTSCIDVARFFWGCNLPKSIRPVYFGNVLSKAQVENLSAMTAKPSERVSATGESDNPIARFLAGELKEGEGRNSALYEFAKEMGKTNLPVEVAAMAVANALATAQEPIDIDEARRAFSQGWKKTRKQDIPEEVEASFQDTFLMRDLALEPLEVLVEGLMHRVGLTMIAGSPGVGKSLLTMNLAIAISSGQPKFLHYDIKTHGKVLWIDYEMTLQEFQKRLKTIPIVPAEGMFKVMLDAPEITKHDFLTKLEEMLELEKPVLLVIDNVTTAQGKDENVAKDVKAVLRPLQVLSKTYKVNIILVHHFRKHVSFQTLQLDSIVGSGVFSRILHTALLVAESAKELSVRIIKVAKLRNWESKWKAAYGAKLKSDLTFEYIGEVDELEHLPSAVIETKAGIDWSRFIQAKEEVSRKELLKRIKATGIDASVATLDRWINRAKESGDLIRVRDGYYKRKQKLSEMVSADDIEKIKKDVYERTTSDMAEKSKASYEQWENEHKTKESSDLDDFIDSIETDGK